MEDNYWEISIRSGKVVTIPFCDLPQKFFYQFTKIDSVEIINPSGFNLNKKNCHIRFFYRNGMWQIRNVKISPDSLIRKIRFNMQIWGRNGQNEPINDKINVLINFSNPFCKLNYSKLEELSGTLISDIGQFDSLKRSFLENSKVDFVYSPPGSGKTSFFYEWRSWLIKDHQKKSLPLPLIVIVNPLKLYTKLCSEDIWDIDSKIREDLSPPYGRFYQLLDRKHREAFLILHETLIKLEEQFNGFRENNKFYKIDYQINFRYFSTEFRMALREELKGLAASRFFSGHIVIIIDDFNVNPELLGCLFHLNHVFPEIHTVITIRFPLNILMQDEELEAINNIYKLLYKQEISVKEIFPLGRDLETRIKQIKKTIERSLPENWSIWWEDYLIQYLIYLSGGNLQALISILYHWWLNTSSNRQGLHAIDCHSLYEKKKYLNQLINGILLKHNVGDDSSNLQKLWDEYFEIISYLLSKHDSYKNKRINKKLVMKILSPLTNEHITLEDDWIEKINPAEYSELGNNFVLDVINILKRIGFIGEGLLGVNNQPQVITTIPILTKFINPQV